MGISFSSVRRFWLGAGQVLALSLWLFSQHVNGQSPSVVIAVEDDAAPWSQADGTGYANDIVLAAFKAVGISVDFRVVPYARCKRMAINGDVHGCFSMSPSKEFNDAIELSAKPLFTCAAGYFYNVNKPPRVSRQQDLPPKTVVGTVIGYEYPPQFESLINRGVIVLEPSESEDLNLRKLALGRVDFAVLTHNETKTASWLIRRAGLTGKVKVGFSAGALKSYIGFSKKSPGGHWALREFNRGHRAIITNGTLRQIRTKWSRELSKKQ
jgi:polar amino acid transport system substrate-binding protein